MTTAGQVARPSLVVGLMVVGLLLRLPGLSLGLWRDEGVTYFDSLPETLTALIETVSRSELNPPGFFVVMQQWMQAFGASEVVFKLPALIFGLLLIPATYGVGVAAGSAGAGLVAAIITTLAPEAIYYSQEARPYTLTALLCCVVVLFYLRALAGQRRAWSLVGFVACAVLLLYVHYTGLLLIGSLAVVSIAFSWWTKDARAAAAFGAAFVIIFVLFTPWLDVFLTHLQTGTPWMTKSAWWTRPRLFVSNLTYTVPLPLAGDFYDLSRRAIALLLLAALGVGTWRLFRAGGQWSGGQWFRSSNTPFDAGAATLASTFVLLALMLAVLSYGRRYMFPFAPIAWVFGGWLVVALFQYVQRPRYRAWCQALAVLTGALFVGSSTSYALSLGNIQKSGIRALAIDLEDTRREKTLYVLSPDVLGSTFGYYTASAPVEFYGFARWARPELFSPQGYTDLWDNPALVSEVERHIRAKASNGYRHLALVQQSGIIGDAGRVKLSRANELLSGLKHTYTLVETRHYPGWLESVTVYLFALASPIDPLSGP